MFLGRGVLVRVGRGELVKVNRGAYVGVFVKRGAREGVEVAVRVEVAEGEEVSERVIDGEGVGDDVSVGDNVGVGVAERVEEAIKLVIWATIGTDSGLLSSQDWISTWSIFSTGGLIFVFDETIFCPVVKSTSPAVLVNPHLPSRQQTVMRLVAGSTQTLI